MWQAYTRPADLLRPAGICWACGPRYVNLLLTREQAETRQDSVVDPILVTIPAPPESANGPLNRFQKAGLIEQSRDLARQERTKIVGSVSDFVNDFGPAVDKADDVLEIVAAEMVTASTPGPGLQLRRKQVRRRDCAYPLVGRQRQSPGMVERRSLPSVVEAENRCVTGHQVD